MMNHRVTTGLIAGGILGAAGVTWVLGDHKMRKKIAKKGNKIAHKAGNLMDLK